jgi:hypothetical protein
MTQDGTVKRIRHALFVTLVYSMLVCQGLDAKKTKCEGPKKHNVDIDPADQLPRASAGGFQGYQVRNKANFQLRNIASFVECYKKCVGRSELDISGWDLDAKDQCGSFQYDVKKKICTMYSALAFKDDKIDQVKICKSDKKHKDRYIAGTFAYKYPGMCWLPNKPSDYCRE